MGELQHTGWVKQYAETAVGESKKIIDQNKTYRQNQ
jgi:hypothetical protein